MDVLSHGLWAEALAKGAVEPKIKRKLNWVWVFFWGVFPDVFAFLIPFIVMFYKLTTGDMAFGEWPRPEEIEPGEPEHLPMHSLTTILYNFSHSLFIFALIALLIYAIKKRFYFVILGWPLHILCDVPTHTYQFFPTPVFWPVSDLKFDGFSWATPWFMILNYSLLLLIFALIKLRKKRNDQ